MDCDASLGIVNIGRRFVKPFFAVRFVRVRPVAFSHDDAVVAGSWRFRYRCLPERRADDGGKVDVGSYTSQKGSKFVLLLFVISFQT